MCSDDEKSLESFRNTVDKINRLASKLYGATTETELNNVYDELVAYMDEPKENERFTDIIMSGFRAFLAVARISLLQNIKLTNRVIQLENRVKVLESQ